jgi:poly(hydroxyalkanoate) granule-associated protein
MEDNVAVETPRSTAEQTAEQVAAGLRRLWLAALGVWPTLEESGGRLFDTLVENGERFESGRAERFSAVSEKVGGAVESAREKVEGGVRGLGETVRGWASRGGEAFDRKVVAALQRSGLPTREEFQTVMRRLDEVAARLDEIKSGRTHEGEPQQQ